MTDEKPHGKGKKIRLRCWIIAAFAAAFIVFIGGFSQDCPLPDPACCTGAPGGTNRYLPVIEFIGLGVVFIGLLFILLIVFSIYRSVASTGIVDSKLPARDLGVGERDIKNIRKAGVKVRILQGLIAVLLPLLYFIVFRLGVSLRQMSCPNIGYPYCCEYTWETEYSLMLPTALAGKKRGSRIAVFLMSAIAFLVAMKSAPVFGQIIPLYSVASRE